MPAPGAEQGIQVMTRKRRVLFLAEPATLAHVVRPLVLATALDLNQYDVTFATGSDFRDLTADAGIKSRPLWSIGSKAYLAAVSAGRPVFPYRVLQRYVAEDLRHIAEIKPDLVVGDFRLSLAVSARLAQVPYLAISNAYWSPHTQVRFEVPVHFVTRLIGAKTTNSLFRLLRPLIFAQHSLPMHRLRRQHNMPSLGFDLRRIFTEADVTLFADVPELVPTDDCGIPDRYIYIGPITWSPEAPLPDALINASDPRPLVYVNMGSSGDPVVLRDIVAACASVDCRLAVATGRGGPVPGASASMVSAPFLPGRELASRAALVICNGGSPSTHQALQQGTPVLGIPANLDQLLNMQFIVNSGSGVSLRADCLSAEKIKGIVRRMLSEPSFRTGAARVASWFAHYSASERFSTVVDTHLERESKRI